jgi:hypothetical protein
VKHPKHTKISSYHHFHELVPWISAVRRFEGSRVLPSSPTGLRGSWERGIWAQGGVEGVEVGRLKKRWWRGINTQPPKLVVRVPCDMSGSPAPTQYWNRSPWPQRAGHPTKQGHPKTGSGSLAPHRTTKKMCLWVRCVSHTLLDLIKSTCDKPRSINHVPLYSTVFPKLKFKPKIKLNHHLSSNTNNRKLRGHPLLFTFPFFYPCTHLIANIKYLNCDCHYHQNN